VTFEKSDKWLLASHLQKSIRRGWADEAQWAAGELHQVDRSYLAYRLSVIAVEDVAAGDVQTISQAVDPNVPWGAKRFGNKNDVGHWRQLARTWAECTKDRTPCEWMSCSWKLSEFEALHGAWIDLTPHQGVLGALDDQLSWWERGLMAWRACGTDRFPSHHLPEASGDFQAWIETTSGSLRAIMTGLGGRQREAHPVFLPLALASRQNEPATLMAYPCGEVVKSGPWILPALDKHTSEGKKALVRFFRSCSFEDRSWLLEKTGSEEMALNVLGQLMFWMEGGRCDRFWSYPTQELIGKSTKAMWQEHHNVSGMELIKRFGHPQLWNRSKMGVVAKPHLGMS
jgi:hypothetical protein